MQQVTVRIPASTSNFGPGFDSFGMALRIHNFVTVCRGPAAALVPMLKECAAAFFQVSGSPTFDFSVAIGGEVPMARGLGSSVTLRLGLLLGLNALAGSGLSLRELFVLCAQLEGHPDNAAPGAFGGFTIAADDSLQRFSVSPRLKVVLLVPNFEVSTKQARELLPKTISRADATSNVANAAAIAAAFAVGDFSELRGHFADRMHQPFRKKLVPFLDDVIAAAEHAGALGAFLSGSGSTICALALRKPESVAQAMLGASGLNDALTIVTRADNSGAVILKSEIKPRKLTKGRIRPNGGSKIQ